MSRTSKHTHLLYPEIDTIAECIGAYDKTSQLCKKYCVLRLRCAIEQDHMMRMEMFEEWVATQDDICKLQ